MYTRGSISLPGQTKRPKKKLIQYLSKNLPLIKSDKHFSVFCKFCSLGKIIFGNPPHIPIINTPLGTKFFLGFLIHGYYSTEFFSFNTFCWSILGTHVQKTIFRVFCVFFGHCIAIVITIRRNGTSGYINLFVRRHLQLLFFFSATRHIFF